MKTIGLIGGMSWESTQHYYRDINRGVNRALGGLHSAEILLYSLDFARIERLQRAGDWKQMAGILAQAGRKLEQAGADFLLICTNTMHRVAPDMALHLSIPILHIADATATELEQRGIRTAGLLGTSYTMQQPFYRQRLQECHGIQTLIPDAAGCADVHRIIFEELCKGQIRSESREHFVHQIDELYRRGAQAVILGCTEIAMLVQQEHTQVPLLDTTAIHAQRAVELALAD